MCDYIFSSLGQEYEFKLQRKLTELNIAFRDEEQLRKCGYDKTPDIKLEVPIGLYIKISIYVPILMSRFSTGNGENAEDRRFPRKKLKCMSKAGS